MINTSLCVQYKTQKSQKSPANTRLTDKYIKDARIRPPFNMRTASNKTQTRPGYTPIPSHHISEE